MPGRHMVNGIADKLAMLEDKVDRESRQMELPASTDEPEWESG